jgi:hypothetical protein
MPLLDFNSVSILPCRRPAKSILDVIMEKKVPTAVAAYGLVDPDV